MSQSEPTTVADIEGSWVDQRFGSGLIDRCRRGWNTPVAELTSEVLATYLRQRIALSITVPEARRRIAVGFTDDSELYPDELANALSSATGEA